MIAIYDNYLETNKDLINAISNISEGKKPKLGPDEVLVIKGKKEEAIDIDDLRDYLKKGWELHEATLTKSQQDMVKDVVDNDLDLEEFEKKYGKKDGKSVAFAVATKMVKKKEGITEDELDEGKIQTKIAKTKKGKITVTDHDSLEDAKKHLEDMKKKGWNGIISQDGKPITEEDELDEVKTPKYGTTNLSKRSGGATVSAREVPGYGMEAYTFSNKTQADKHAKKVGGETYHLGRVFYVRMKESVESDEALEGMKEDDLDEGKMSELHAMIKDGKSAKEIAKEMKLDEKTIAELMKGMKEIKEEEVDETVEVDGRKKAYKETLNRIANRQKKIKEKNDTKEVHIMGDSHWEASDELVQYLRKLTPGEISEKGIKEEVKD